MHPSLARAAAKQNGAKAQEPAPNDFDKWSIRLPCTSDLVRQTYRSAFEFYWIDERSPG